ncbi:nitronate monooxygenase [Nonomuraea roseoviolacea subsp. roseoviolacea]|uniref:Nitronate monooxygenase n=1 Tax=Nonomuraea roseoviolacea subsp. carminata TaxID=160689 RepID=A0ABT1K940_9ACTN|nr:nitronate monooxygenase [Nonomuraea roseoviolacea]MCP2350107.1 nitronate monooxygenase [Nonomuraea roseoviolacea subsp. carminata]
MRTWLTERFDLTVPLVGAPMAGVGAGRLAAAVSAAGALGMFGVPAAATAEWIREQASVAAAPGRPYGIGLMAWALPGNPAQLQAVLDARPAVVSVSFGPYESYVTELRQAGITVVTQAGTTEEALAAERAGVDAVVARGAEGGGHGRADVATLPLLEGVLDAVRIPVLAAGGVATARGLAAVLAAGAEGAWAGTAFMGCEETTISPEAMRRLLEAAETDTAYGRVFDVAQRLGWPVEYGGRALRNAFFDRWAGREDELAADDSARADLETARRDQDFDTAFIYVGQGVGLVRERRTAADVVAAFAGAEKLLNRFAR